MGRYEGVRSEGEGLEPRLWSRPRSPRYIEDMIVAQGGSPRRATRNGFSLLELVVVLVIVGVTMGVGITGYRTYQQNTAARRAAEVFVMDLSVARSSAVRERRPVAVIFDEANLSYRIETSQGRVIRVRDFSSQGEIPIGSISLDLNGDEVVFNGRGFADLAGAVGSLGLARFEAGGGRYEVRFNALGRARIEPF